VVRRPEVLAALKNCMGIFMPSASQGLDGEVTMTLGAKGVIECELIPAASAGAAARARMCTPATKLASTARMASRRSAGNSRLARRQRSAIEGYTAKVRRIPKPKKR